MCVCACLNYNMFVQRAVRSRCADTRRKKKKTGRVIVCTRIQASEELLTYAKIAQIH